MTVNLAPILNATRQTLKDHDLEADSERMATVFTTLAGLCLSHPILTGERDLAWQQAMSLKLHKQLDDAIKFAPGMNFDLH